MYFLVNPPDTGRNSPFTPSSHQGAIQAPFLGWYSASFRPWWEAVLPTSLVQGLSSTLWGLYDTGLPPSGYMILCCEAALSPNQYIR